MRATERMGERRASPAAAPRSVGSRPRRTAKTIVFVGALAGAAMIAVSAFAFFTTIGSGQGAAATGTFSAPTSVSATVPNPAVATVHLTWTAPTPPTGSLDGYTVSRSDGTTTAAACGTGTTPLPGTAISCDDTSVADGTYTYTVTAIWRSWTSASSASSSITVATQALHHFAVVPGTGT